MLLSYFTGYKVQALGKPLVFLGVIMISSSRELLLHKTKMIDRRDANLLKGVIASSKGMSEKSIGMIPGASKSSFIRKMC